MATTISVRVEDDLKDLAEDAASGEGLSVSGWVRQLMRGAVGLDVREWSAPASLSKRDRRQLVLLHRIVRAVTDDDTESEYHDRMIKVLEHGFTGEYSDAFEALYDELPLDECRLVWDILDMFRVIEASVREIGLDRVRQLDDHAEGALRFRGFDFNDSREGRLADYAEHLVRNGRWEEMAIYFDSDHERGNSHLPMLGSYMRMLDVFQPMWREMIHGAGRGRHLLGEDELRQIVQAWYHPERRERRDG